MANAVYNSAGGFTNNPSAASSRTDPITLDGLVNATLLTPSGTANPLRSLTNNVIYEPPGRTQVLPNYSLLSGTYNFTGGQLTLNRQGTAGEATQFELLGQSGQDTVLYIGYDNIAPNAQLTHYLAENFILNFDDVSQNGGVISNSATSIQTGWNQLLSDFCVVDVSPVARWIVNIPVTSFGNPTAVNNLGRRNVLFMGNNNALTNIRMTINMGRYANNVLTDADSRLGTGGANYANCTMVYNLGPNVSTRDILYRGDYVDWRPFRGSTTWRPLTGGGFIGDQGIKWLIEDQSNTVVSNTNPLIFGSSGQNFALGISGTSTLDKGTGNGSFQLGLSPLDSDRRVNRVVFINPTGIEFQTQLGLWNNQRGRLRVEHQTTIPFHISDDVEENVNDARVVLRHFYPTYGSDTVFTAAAAATFNRQVFSTAVTDSTGTATLGNTTNADYAAADTYSDTVNRPIIVEALELNGSAGAQTYHYDTDAGSTIIYSDYTNSGTLTQNAATYDVFAFGHEPSLNNAITFTPASRTSNAEGVEEQVQIRRDRNVSVENRISIPTRANTLADVYDILHVWSIDNRMANPVTANGNVLEFGGRNVTFSLTANLSVGMGNTGALVIPTSNSLGPSMAANDDGNIFDTVVTTSTDDNRFSADGVDISGITVAGPNAPTITVTGLNRDELENMLPGRLDIFDVTGGRSQSATPLAFVEGDFANNKSVIIDRMTRVLNGVIVDSGGTAAFAGMGQGDSGAIRSLAFIYSRPGFVAEQVVLDVSGTGNLTVPFMENLQPYPNNTSLGEERDMDGNITAPNFAASAAYDPATNIITVMVSSGPAEKTLSAAQTNRLMMENVYGTAAFNRFAFANNSVTFTGSLGAASSWFANGANFKVGTASQVYFIGYIDNQNPNPSTNGIGITTTVTENSIVGTQGAVVASSPDAFDLRAIAGLTVDQTQELQQTLSNFQGDPLGTSATDASTLNDVRTELRAARNIILGNL